MQLKEFDILLDIKRNKKVEEFEIVQGDYETNILKISLVEDFNEYDLSGLSVEIAFAKSDGTTVLQDLSNGITLVGNKIVCTLKTNTIASPGKVLAEVRVLEGPKLLTSSRFSFFVRQSIVNDKTIESTNEYPILNKMIEDVTGLLDEIQSKPEIQGYSAYQVWLNQGNVGTVDDYLASLIGPQGEIGPPGPQGIQGERGPTGSIANLDKGNIEEALGYTPADTNLIGLLASLTTEQKTNLVAAINEVNDGLSEHKAEATNKIFKLQNWELQNRNRSTKPIVTFIDDDGKAAVLTKLKPLSQVYGVPFTLALYVKAIEDEADTYMSRSDVKTLQDTLGWEMSSHTYNHLNLTTLTDEEQEYQMKHSKKVMESWGLDVSTLCYPYDGRNDKSYELARKYYRAARRSYGGINTAPLETFELRSTCLGSWFDTQGANPYPTNSLDYYKYQVDQAIDNNGWTIFLTHCADPDHDSIQQQYLEETIQYCIQRGIEIVTFNEGLNRMGNIIDVGHYSKIDTSKKHFVLGADGTVATKDIQDLSKMTGANEYTATTKPSEFKFGKMYITRITVAGATGFPSNKAGTLITNAITGFTAGLPYLFQEYHVYDSEEIYKRVGKSNGTWGLWERVDSFFVRMSSNVVTPDTPASEFRPGKISICQITTSGATGFPLSSAGILTTNRFAGISGFAFQEYDVYNSWSKFKRYQLASGSWSAWKEINMA